MGADLRRHPHPTGRHVRHHFANFLAPHNHAPLKFSSPLPASTNLRFLEEFF
jgi:hypothetical protein